MSSRQETSNVGELLSDDDIDLYLVDSDSLKWLTHNNEGVIDWAVALELSSFVDAIRSPTGHNGRRFTPSKWVLDVIAARTAGRKGIPPRPPTPEDQVADDWSLIEGLIGMEEVNKIEEIVGDAHNWGSPPAYQAPAAKEWNSPSPAVQLSPAMPRDGIPVVVDPESATTAAALLPWLAIGLALAKKPIN